MIMGLTTFGVVLALSPLRPIVHLCQRLNPRVCSHVLRSVPQRNGSTKAINAPKDVAGSVAKVPRIAMTDEYEKMRKEIDSSFILLYQVGEFYELMGDDAERVAQRVALRTSDRGSTKLAGFPVANANVWIDRMLQAGFNIAVAEQTTTLKRMQRDDVRTQKMSRAIVRYITPGTRLDEGFESRDANYLLAVTFEPLTPALPRDNRVFVTGLAWADVSTGEFVMSVGTTETLEEDLDRVKPAEILVDAKHVGLVRRALLDNKAAIATMMPLSTATKRANVNSQRPGIDSPSPSPHVQPSLEEDAADAIREYVQKIMLRSAISLPEPVRFSRDTHMSIDSDARRALELVEPFAKNVQGLTGGDGVSLLSNINRTRTAPGGRMLKRRLCSPSMDRVEIVARLDAVEHFIGDNWLRATTVKTLQEKLTRDPCQTLRKALSLRVSTNVDNSEEQYWMTVHRLISGLVTDIRSARTLVDAIGDALTGELNTSTAVVRKALPPLEALCNRFGSEVGLSRKYGVLESVPEQLAPAFVLEVEDVVKTEVADLTQRHVDFPFDRCTIVGNRDAIYFKVPREIIVPKGAYPSPPVTVDRVLYKFSGAVDGARAQNTRFELHASAIPQQSTAAYTDIATSIVSGKKEERSEQSGEEREETVDAADDKKSKKGEKKRSRKKKNPTDADQIAASTEDEVGASTSTTTTGNELLLSSPDPNAAFASTDGGASTTAFALYHHHPAPTYKLFLDKIVRRKNQAARDECVRFLKLFENEEPNLRAVSNWIGGVDIASSLANIAVDRGFCRPTLTDGVDFHIVDGRHPVVEFTLLQKQWPFTPNDCSLDISGLWLVTGPNMGGKSTFLRQNAVMTIMAQMGSFVPASKAVIGIVDKVFARVGASDNLAREQSTFMVEMLETSRILNHATERSFVIMDEIGRGTAIVDGLCIATAVLEHLRDVIRCRGLAATHFSELADVALQDAADGSANRIACVMLESIQSAQALGSAETTESTRLEGSIDSNAEMPEAATTNARPVVLNAVADRDAGVTFTHKVVRGVCYKSRGIEVAGMAGFPSSVLDRARAIMRDHEHRLQSVAGHAPQTRLDDRHRQTTKVELQSEQSSIVESDFLRRLIVAANPDELSPREAHAALYAIRAAAGVASK